MVPLQKDRSGTTWPTSGVARLRHSRPQGRPALSLRPSTSLSPGHADFGARPPRAGAAPERAPEEAAYLGGPYVLALVCSPGNRYTGRSYSAPTSPHQPGSPRGRAPPGSSYLAYPPRAETTATGSCSPASARWRSAACAGVLPAHSRRPPRFKPREPTGALRPALQPFYWSLG